MTGTASLIDLNLRLKIDALVRGECSEDEFVEEIASRSGGVDSAWDVIALIDQRFRRGQIPAALFRSIESKITRRELGAADHGTTIDLVPLRIAAPAAEADATIPAEAAFAAAAMPPQVPGQHSTILVVGRVLRDRYVIERCLGRGGMGSVYKAVDRFRTEQPGIGAHIALKVLHAGGTTESGPRQLAKLRREFYSTQALSHPSIVKVFEFDRDDDVAFFTMELIEGEVLSRMMRGSSPKPLPRTEAWRIIRDVASALVHAHERKVLHADLKPQNIMVTRTGEVRVVDFGSSSGSHDNNISALTPAYASCELLEGRPAETRDDLYALACLSYELLAGVHPFQHRRSTEACKLGLVPARPQGLTGRQWQALRAGLAWDRDERPQSVREWIGALDRQRDPAPAWNFRRAAVAAALLAVCVAIAAIVERIGYRSAAIDAPRAGPLATMAGDAPPVPADSLPARTPAAAAPIAATLAVAPAPAAMPEATPIPPQSAARMESKIAKSAGSGPARKTESIGISAAAYRLRPGEHFAEVHVTRSLGSEAGTSFTWWTEPGSADPGTDFVPQAKTTTFFLAGKRTARLVVKVLSNPSRRRLVSFSVWIGDPSGSRSLGLAKTTVFLPPG